MSQLATSALYQGTKYDPHTGELPGIIHHEVPGTELPNRKGLTTYNACDTTPLFLLGAEALSHSFTPMNEEFLEKYHGNFERAVDHILDSLGETDGLYWDKSLDARALQVTMWKDSQLPHASGKKEPKYPVSYSLAHFMAARGMLAASRILDNPELEQIADDMYRNGIDAFITPDYFVVYKDSEDELKQTSSDEIHLLAYIPQTYVNRLPIDAIQQRARELATPFGYMCTPPKIARTLEDTYHGDKVWVFEQALIHYGASKFNLHEEATVADGIADLIDEGQELFGIEYTAAGDLTLIPEGNSQQLWSVAAAAYFSGKSTLQHSSWL
jgi:glycogen debranching enzyme